MTKTIPKSLQGILGETRVCAEILKKGLNAAITHGNSKAADLLAFGPDGRYIRVEVKTSYNGKRFVTGYYPKYSNPEALHPDVWVFYLPDKQLSACGDRFFITTHAEAGRLQLDVNRGRKTIGGGGVDNIPLSKLTGTGAENAWIVIFEALGGKDEAVRVTARTEHHAEEY